MANDKGEFLTWHEYMRAHNVPGPYDDMRAYMMAHTDWVLEYNPNIAGGDADAPFVLVMSEHTHNQLTRLFGEKK